MTKITLSNPSLTAMPRTVLHSSGRALRGVIIAGAAVVGSLNPLSAAEPFIPAITFPAERASFAGRNVDILSLVPGMTPQETRAALLTLPAPETLAEKKTSFAVASRGVEVQTVEFVETIESGPDNDRLSVSFTGPASDNQVFVVRRNARYPEVLSAPTVEAIVEALVSKYGTPSYDTRDFYDTTQQQLIWTFKSGEQAPCQGLGGYGSGQRCPFAGRLYFYDPSQLSDLATETLDFDYAIIAEIDTHGADRTKVVGFDVTAGDLLRRKRAAAVDTQALLEELDRVHAEASRPAAAPSM